MRPEDQKQAAARAALDHVKPGMKLGLGSGSTAAHFIEGLGERVRGGLQVLCVPTSLATKTQAEKLGISLTTLDQTPALDLAVDGADEIDDELTLIKGGGGCLLREKIVAASSRRMIVIADASKRVKQLGKFPLPVEVAAFGVKSTAYKIQQAAAWAGCKGPISMRVRDRKPFVTENGNVILDCAFGSIAEPPKLAAALSSIPGVVEFGLFIKLASLAIIGTAAGTVTLNPGNRK